MPQVVVEINGRAYTLQCGEGQEDHLRRLARRVEEEVAAIRESAGPLGDIRLLIMASLVLADRIHELNQQLEAARANDASAVVQRLLKSLESATERLQALSMLAAEQQEATASPPGTGDSGG